MTGGRNGYAALVRQRSKGVTKRRKLDDYETPEEVTATLTDVIGGQLDGFRGPILEPACGTGRLARGLRKLTGKEVTGFDIKRGHDFLKRVEPWKGDIVTNPPYRDGLAEKFCRHALKLASGRVAMLVQSGFVWGGKRARGLYTEFRPEAVIVIPDRVYFIVPGEGAIDSQFFTHCWIVWPERRHRGRNGHETRIFWPLGDDFDFG
jgi:SAM-dependent methyltransferase